MVNPENMGTNNIRQTKQVVLRNIYVYTCMYMQQLIKMGGHEFEGEQGGVYGKLWR